MASAPVDTEHTRRRRWLMLLALLVLLLLCIIALFIRYLLAPAPLPELLPVAGVFPPHYLFSIYGVDQPVGVALSPRSDRLYVTESGGSRLIKIFEREGQKIDQFSAPHTSEIQRAPVYLATDQSGRVFVTDRLQRAVYVFDRNGNYIDALLSPSLSLSEYVAQSDPTVSTGGVEYINMLTQQVVYQKPGQEQEHMLPLPPEAMTWSPLGVTFDASGSLLITDAGGQTVHSVPAAALSASDWRNFNAAGLTPQFGEQGEGNGQLMFPNDTAVDSQRRVYVSDGNNGRITVWDGRGGFLFAFGRGAGDGALNLPRGLAMGEGDRLYVVDPVAQTVKVYDVSASEPKFLFQFGDFGQEDGQFNFPNDIALDTAGRIYIADRENNRIQVWSY